MPVTLEGFRRLALSLPGVAEDAHMGHPDFRVRGKIFATLCAPDERWGMVKLTPEQQDAFVELAPAVFTPVKGGWGRRGATNVRLQAVTVRALRPALATAWRNAAPNSQWTKAPESLVALFERALGAIPGARTRKMFGYPAAFTGGHMFSGLFQNSMILRLSAEDRSALLAQPDARPFEPMPGRLMREYVVVPEAVLSSEEALRPWLRKAHTYAASLPPKTGHGKKAAARSRKR